MAFKSLDAMYSELSNQNIITWKLLDTKGNMVSEFTADKPDLVIQRLKEVLDGQNDDLFALEYKNNLASAAKGFRNTFRNRDDVSGAAIPVQQAQVAGNSKEEVASAIEKALADYKKEMEVAGIIEKNKELEKQLKEATPSKFEATVIKIGEVLLPLVENYTNKAAVGKVPKKQEPIKNTQNPNDPNFIIVEEKEPSGLNMDEEKLANNLSGIVERIAEAGLDPVEVTEKLANLSPDKLNMALKFL